MELSGILVFSESELDRSDRRGTRELPATYAGILAERNAGHVSYAYHRTADCNFAAAVDETFKTYNTLGRKNGKYGIFRYTYAYFAGN